MLNEAAPNMSAATFLTGLQVPDDVDSSLYSSEADAAATAHAAVSTEDDSGFVGRTLLALDLQRTSYLSEKFQVCSLLMNFSIYIHSHCLQ
jgi:hypothetical protein